jgi:glucuronokinase
MQIIRHCAYARAGLIGNPSDGYGGKTISFAFQEFAANVVMYPWDQVEVVWSEQDRNRFDSVDDLIEDVTLNGYYGGVRLVKATIKRFVEYCREHAYTLHDQPFSVRYDTTIPRGVGLSGSSAIVVATLRCLLEFYSIDLARDLQSSLARSVENDELGIACGYQDRVAQVYQGLVFMDFGQMRSTNGLQVGLYEELDASLLHGAYIAYDMSRAKTSASVHGPLRTRVSDNAELAATMAEIASLVDEARLALERQDADSLHRLLNHNFDLRRELYPISTANVAMIQTARAVGASAKFAGSGGAIVGTVRDDAMYVALCQAMTSESSEWHVIRPTVANAT